MPTRLELSVADLMRVRVSSTLGPLAETALAYSVLQPRVRAASPRTLSTLVRRATPSDRALASYLWLSPTVGFDVFTTGGAARTVAEGGEALLGAPDAVWHTETSTWAAMRAEARRRGVLGPAGGAAAADLETALGTGDADSWERLLVRLGAGFASLVEPSWRTIRDRLDAEADRLAHRAASGGLEALASALGPGVRWSGSTVELPGSGVTGTHTVVIPLEGRGLTVVPSFFALRPMVYRPTQVTDPVLLIVPCASTGPDLPRAGRDAGAVAPPGAELLGRTRAAVLTCLARGPRTTSELSAELGIALSGASQHAAVLRRAGLVSTVRVGGHVRHSVTELGGDLVRRL